MAYPGREATYDCNSQVPSGCHNGRTIYYVFGRYPAQPDGNRYPVLDLVICHGDLLNADHQYVHGNRSVKGFGSYGDIMIRDRKMYVAPTPFGLLDGVAHQRTLIIPEDVSIGNAYVRVGEIVRKEVDQLLVAYSFDLRNSEISAQWTDNPTRGQEHHFAAYRVAGDSAESVSLRHQSQPSA